MTIPLSLNFRLPKRPSQSTIPFSETRPSLQRTQPLFPESNSDETPSHGNSSSVSEKPLPHHQISTLQRIGWYSLAILVLGSLILSFAVGFLIFLWWGHQDRSNTAWRWLVLEGWISVTVTLAALCIQLTVSAQAAVAISMLASWTLEQWGTPIGQSVAIATMGFVNTGPLASLAVFCQNLKTFGGSTVFLLAALLASMTVLSQFSSTLLFSDVPLGTLPGYSRMFEIPMNWGNDTVFARDDFNRVDFNQMSPQAYPTFAEYKNSSTKLDNMVDTGTTLRGFLPLISEADRTSLQHYEGPMPLMDFRVVCVRPFFLEATLNASNGRFFGAAIPSRNDLSLTEPRTEFDCSTYTVNGVDYSMQTICKLAEIPGSGMKDWPTEYFNISDNATRGVKRMFINRKGFPSGLNFSLTENTTEIKGWKTSYNGPWFNFEATEWSGDIQPVLNVSLCYDTV